VSTQNGQQADSLLCKKEAARYLGVSDGTLERLMRNGLPFIKLTPGSAGAVRFHVDDLKAFTEARRVTLSTQREGVPATAHQYSHSPNN
jgi:excisionase family DNA binding protein